MLLVVEDEPSIRDLLESALVEAGFDVLMACDGTQAIAELNSHGNRLLAVITDIRLGTGPDGWEVGRHGRELVPSIPIVYLTGDSGHAWHFKGVVDSVLVGKPFVLSQIVAVVSGLVKRGGPGRVCT